MKLLIKLPVIDELNHNLVNSPQFLQVILGPRQVGKTTSVLLFLKSYQTTHHYVSADKVFGKGHEWLLENWQKARTDSALLVIDEIQKIENWSEVVKKLWDEEKLRAKPIKCILLGSSSLDIQKGLTESLTGRFQLLRMHHWNAQESARGFDISFEDYLQIGGYPGSYAFSNDRKQWVDYIQHSVIETVIEKDILLNHTVKSPALFRQAFELLMSYPAQEISYTKLLGLLQGKGNTDLIKNYLRLYEGAFLVKALEKFSTNKLKVRSSSPKILPLCPAFYYAGIQAPYSSAERGHVFEMVVGAQLVRTGAPLYYWREKNDEVDYVVKVGRKIYAIEVKSGKRERSTGLEAFQKKFPTSKCVIINTENYIKFEASPIEFMDSVS
jgi:uncharacterized protein